MSKAWWTSGKHGSLSPWSQATVAALLRLRQKGKIDLGYDAIAKEVTKVGGGHPSKQGIALMNAVLDHDRAWYPGKVSENARKRGPKPVFAEKSKVQVAKSAMSLKKRGLEPSVPAILTQTPKAAKNPRTKRFFSAPTIAKVLKERCFDERPEDPWVCVNPCSKTALPPEVIVARAKWAKTLRRNGRTAQWYFNNCIWLDPCNTVIPAAKRTIFDHQQSSKGKRKRWMSKGSRKKSRNLQATPYAGKQRQWADKRAWWFVIMSRGKVVLELMPQDWVQTGPGMAELVHRLPHLLRKRLGSGPLPRTIATDRGPGFYQASSGTIVAAYKEALDEEGFTPFAGEEAKWQPPDVPDVLLHETVVSWVRAYFRKRPFKWVPKVEENCKLFRKMMKQCEQHINKSYDVAGLCRSFPRRIEALVASGGDRLKS